MTTVKNRWAFLIVMLMVMSPLAAQDFKKIESVPALSAAFEQARSEGKILLVYFKYDHFIRNGSCGSCENYDNVIFKDESVLEFVDSKTLPIKIELPKDGSNDQTGQAYSSIIPGNYSRSVEIHLVDPENGVLLATTDLGNVKSVKTASDLMEVFNEGVKKSDWVQEVLSRDYSTISGEAALKLYQQLQEKDPSETYLRLLALKVAHELENTLWTDPNHAFTLAYFVAKSTEHPNFQYLITHQQEMLQVHGREAWSSFIGKNISNQLEESIALKDIKIVNYITEVLFPLVNLPEGVNSIESFDAYGRYYLSTEDFAGYLAFISKYEERDFYAPVIRAFVESWIVRTTELPKSFYLDIAKVYQALRLTDNVPAFYYTIANLRALSGDDRATEKMVAAFGKYINSIKDDKETFLTNFQQLGELTEKDEFKGSDFHIGASKSVVEIYENITNAEEDDRYYSKLHYMYKNIGNKEKAQYYWDKQYE